jgi:hypothetical protein
MNIFMVLYTNVNGTPAYSAEAGYSPAWVDRLVAGIERNSIQRNNFYCLVDNENYQFRENVKPILLSSVKKEGWSPMMECFRPEICSGRRMVFGLDTIITGSIEHILNWEKEGECGLLDDPYVKGKTCNGIGIYDESIVNRFWHMWTERDRLFPNDELYYEGAISEMAFLRIVAREATRLNRIFPEEIQSYKAHWRVNKQKRRNARIVYFHGNPKPPYVERELLEDWGV